VKLIVQIACLNEESTLPATLQDIPRKMPGIDVVEVWVIDEGCNDRTVEIANEHGVEQIVRFNRNRGLGYAFSAGIDQCLFLGADLIINTDDDNQCNGNDITLVVQPILDSTGDIVVGDRQNEKIGHFSFLKRMAQTLGSRVVSGLAGIQVPGVASGFQAYSRQAAMRLVVSTGFDHTVGHVTQARRRLILAVRVPIRTNSKLRESRLFSSIWTFVFRSLGIIIRFYASYEALTIFTIAGLVTGALGAVLGIRFIWIFFFDPSTRHLHVQVLILSAVLLLAGFQMVVTGIVADLLNFTRSIIEDVAYRLRRVESDIQRVQSKFNVGNYKPNEFLEKCV